MTEPDPAIVGNRGRSDSDLRQSYTTREICPTDGPALAELFVVSHTACYCRYWHFDGDKNDWLDRTANRPDENRQELISAVASKSLEALGVIAETSEGAIVGWLKLSPALALPKPYQQRYYRSLPCFGGDREGVYLVGCVLVDPRHRRHGVASALVQAAVALAERRGARAIEALPRRTFEPVSDEEIWMGPISVFHALGFDEVHRGSDDPLRDPYPVLRLDLPHPR